MGNFAAKNGYRGLIVPSARADGGVNIVIFDPKGIDFGTYTTIQQFMINTRKEKYNDNTSKQPAFFAEAEDS